MFWFPSDSEEEQQPHLVEPDAEIPFKESKGKQQQAISWRVQTPTCNYQVDGMKVGSLGLRHHGMPHPIFFLSAKGNSCVKSTVKMVTKLSFCEAPTLYTMERYPP